MTTPSSAEREPEPPGGGPRFGGTWVRLETAVLLALVATIAVLAWLTVHYS